MGILGDIFKKKLEEDDEAKYNVEIIEKKEEDDKPFKLQYNMAWLNRVIIHQGFSPSDDKEKLNGILRSLDKRNGQCPCGGSGSQYKCPCVIMKDQGICKCGLFKTLPDRNMKGSTTVKAIQHNNE